MNDHPDTNDTIDLECNPNIRRLTVRAYFNDPLASYLKHLLSRVSAPNVQQITFVDPLWSGEVNWQGWNEVDDVLAGVKFGRLREVTIVISYCHGQDRIRQRLTDRFPSMYGKGILNIRNITTYY
jgi:hypothetical protein